MSIATLFQARSRYSHADMPLRDFPSKNLSHFNRSERYKSTKRRRIFRQGSFCPICQEIPTAPKLLNCEHVFCKTCLQGLIDSDTSLPAFRCPVCRHIHYKHVEGANGFEDASIVSALPSTMHSSFCSNCRANSSFLCPHCGDRLCENCKYRHTMKAKKEIKLLIDQLSGRLGNPDVNDGQLEEIIAPLPEFIITARQEITRNAPRDDELMNIWRTAEEYVNKMTYLPHQDELIQIPERLDNNNTPTSEISTRRLDSNVNHIAYRGSRTNQTIQNTNAGHSDTHDTSNSVVNEGNINSRDNSRGSQTHQNRHNNDTMHGDTHRNSNTVVNQETTNSRGNGYYNNRFRIDNYDIPTGEDFTRRLDSNVNLYTNRGSHTNQNIPNNNADHSDTHNTSNSVVNQGTTNSRDNRLDNHNIPTREDLDSNVSLGTNRGSHTNQNIPNNNAVHSDTHNTSNRVVNQGTRNSRDNRTPINAQPSVSEPSYGACFSILGTVRDESVSTLRHKYIVPIGVLLLLLGVGRIIFGILIATVIDKAEFEKQSRMITAFIIVKGITGVLFWSRILYMYRRTNGQHNEFQSTFALLLSIFNLVWMILGTVWVFDVSHLQREHYTVLSVLQLITVIDWALFGFFVCFVSLKALRKIHENCCRRYPNVVV
ncbi:uncharacterized protein LOC128550737 isoform X3 [Mercenaria mercenaria]|uniref:uncharacterized protein LOC128550737 isoform X3 n=1 Tax=Mercenaria mercenaria TaxID=6596 RepID=UPI00234EFF0E|nr:uncharacterized protein LOC128550737 isoform X3 [Mercenaria mercenaria]